MTSDSCTPASETSVTEQALAALWSEVLQTTVLPGNTENFFALGGDSMAMVVLEFRIKEEFAVELPAGVVLGAPTLRELATLVEAASGDSRSPDARSAESSATYGRPHGM